MKNVLILSYEGNVLINDIPCNEKRENIIEIARVALQNKLNKSIVSLCNVEYFVNDNIYKYYEKKFNDDVPGDFLDANVDYNIMKKFGDLINKEIDIIELSNELIKSGCEDICEFDNWANILNDGNVIVATDDHGENHIQIHFNITILANEQEEDIKASEIKITNIEEW